MESPNGRANTPALQSAPTVLSEYHTDIGTGMSGPEAFFKYSRDRYRIMIRKNAGYDKPWTDDPIFLEYRFCNISVKMIPTPSGFGHIWVIEGIWTD